MSGSGGGSGVGGGGDSYQDCPDIFEETVLNSPNHVILANINVGDILSVTIYQEAGHPTVVAVDSGGNVAGSITAGSLARLIECLEEGYDYAAVVTAIDGGRCYVQVRLASDL